MSMRTITVVAVAFMLTGPALAGGMPAKQNATAQLIIERARAWAEQACGGKWVISDILAEDFRGTSPKGTRYEKPSGEPPYDPNTQWSTDCRLDQADVRFFGRDIAVMYGAESRTVALPDGKHERRCLVWTDTWLKRKGKWQIIAVQDNRIECSGQ
jgi:hypothetical protein